MENVTVNFNQWFKSLEVVNEKYKVLFNGRIVDLIDNVHTNLINEEVIVTSSAENLEILTIEFKNSGCIYDVNWMTTESIHTERPGLEDEIIVFNEGDKIISHYNDWEFQS